MYVSIVPRCLHLGTTEKTDRSLKSKNKKKIIDVVWLSGPEGAQNVMNGSFIIWLDKLG